MKLLSLFIVLISSLFAATGPAIVVMGEISDSQCVFSVHSSDGTHAAMIKTATLGRSSEECARTCVRMGGKYVLVDPVRNKIYSLANPERAADFAAKQVRVVGVSDSRGVFRITSIAAQ